MNLAPKKPCRKPGCNELTRSGFCHKHSSVERKYDTERKSSSQRGYNRKWREARLVFLSKNPICVECLKQTRLTPATVVDHIVPHKGDPVLFWDVNNWQALCQKCHGIKTASEDGGFGNERKVSCSETAPRGSKK